MRTSRFRIPQAAALLAEMSVNEVRDRWAESLLLIRANPDEVPEQCK